MSCHDIGRGLNEVVRTVIALYDKAEMDKRSAKKIIRACADAVNWCDGNEYEAVDYIRYCRCGNCLKIIPKGEKLFSLWDLPYNYINKSISEKAFIACERLCEDCFEKIMPEYCEGNDSVEILKNKIIENNDKSPERYLSSGEHPKHNNGLEWVNEVTM